MFKLYKSELKKHRGVSKKAIAEMLKWAFWNDRRFLAIFLKNLDTNSDKLVIETTKKALQQALKDEIADSIKTLTSLKGIGNVSATKILMFSYPNKFGMLDQFNSKAIYALKVKGKRYFAKSDANKYTNKQFQEAFEKYTIVLREIGKRKKMRPADVDMALFRIGRGY